MGEKASEAKEIKLNAIYPPIEKIEGPLEKLVNCEKLSLSAPRKDGLVVKMCTIILK